jgi:predicted dehydrogenase
MRASDQLNRPSLHLAKRSRRDFLVSGAAGVVSFSRVSPGMAQAAGAGPKINLGLIGCGGRGTWLLDFFKKHGGYNVVACADYFPDKARQAGLKHGIPENRWFTGLYGYRKMFEHVDAVAIESPPFFHPMQAADAVAAGKHVYLAKPIAVDVPGCQSIAESARQATAKQRAFLVDFQTRAHPAYIEAVKRVHAGAIGPLICGEASYQCPLYFASMDEEYRQKVGQPEARVRAWAVDRVLSGDVITEQNIHSLDVCTWILDAAPLKAYGTGGKARPFAGDCWDHFSAIFWFPKDVLITFCSKQVGRFWDDIQCRVYGAEGTIDTHYGGVVVVHCDDKYNGGTTSSIYADGAATNIAAFHRNIARGDFSNPTVAPSVRSNLTTILGRMACYEKREVTWDEMMRQNEKWEFPLEGLKA